MNTWNNTGNFYVRVTGRGGAFDTSTPFTVTRQQRADDLHRGDRHDADAARRRWRRRGSKTVILTDSSRVALDRHSPVPGAARCATSSRRSPRAPRSRASSSTLPATRGCSALKTQAANNPACPFAKNLVAARDQGHRRQLSREPAALRGHRRQRRRDPVLPLPRRERVWARSPATCRRCRATLPPRRACGCDFVLSQDAYGSKTQHLAAVERVPGAAGSRSAGLSRPPTRSPGLIDAYVAAGGVVSPHDVAGDRATTSSRMPRTRSRSELACGHRSAPVMR